MDDLLRLNLISHVPLKKTSEKHKDSADIYCVFSYFTLIFLNLFYPVYVCRLIYVELSVIYVS